MRNTDPLMTRGVRRERPEVGGDELGDRGDLAFGLTVSGVAFDSDQQPLVQDGEDARQDRDRRDVRSALELGDERVRRPGALGDLSLGELSS